MILNYDINTDIQIDSLQDLSKLRYLMENKIIRVEEVAVEMGVSKSVKVNIKM